MRYSASIAAVNRSFFRISGTRTEFRIVPSALVPIALHQPAGAAGRLDLLPGRPRERVRGHRQLLLQLALAEDLHRDALAGGEPAGPERLRGDAVTLAEAGLEVAQVDRLGVRPELLERHRLLHVRPAQLAQPHVDRHLPALGAWPGLVAAARAGPLLPPARRLPHARALAAAHALAAMARPRRGLQVVEPDLLGHQSSTFTRCWTAWTAPRTVGSSGRSPVRPIRPSPRARRVSRWRGLAPFDDRRCVIRSFFAATSGRLRGDR